MKTSELIKKLTDMKRRHGDLDILITGAYGADTQDFTIKVLNLKNYNDDKGHPYMQIETDLMTG